MVFDKVTFGRVALLEETTPTCEVDGFMAETVGVTFGKSKAATEDATMSPPFGDVEVTANKLENAAVPSTTGEKMTAGTGEATTPPSPPPVAVEVAVNKLGVAAATEEELKEERGEATDKPSLSDDGARIAANVTHETGATEVELMLPSADGLLTWAMRDEG